MRCDDEKVDGVLRRIGDDLYPNQTVMVNAAALRAALLDLRNLREKARAVVDAWDRQDWYNDKAIDALRAEIGEGT
jgi:type II secretory pathway component PulK